MPDVDTSTAFAARTWRELAQALGLKTDRRVYKARKYPSNPAPASKDLVAWYQWSRGTGRGGWAGRLAFEVERRAIAAGILNPLAGKSAPEAAARPEGRAGSTVTMPPAGMPADEAASREQLARVRKTEEDAEAARLKRLEMQKALAPICTFEAFAGQVTGLVIDHMRSRIWHALLPHVNALGPDVVKRLRRAHDDAVGAMRADLARDFGVLVQRTIDQLEEGTA